MLAIGGRIDWSCMQAGIGLEGCCRTIAACGHTASSLLQVSTLQFADKGTPWKVSVFTVNCTGNSICPAERNNITNVDEAR